jgi:hypothetical protein
MLRDLSAIRGRVERLATGTPTACGQHEFSRISEWREEEPEPMWPAPGSHSRCQCGAELRYYHTVIEVWGLSEATAPRKNSGPDGSSFDQRH